MSLQVATVKEIQKERKKIRHQWVQWPTHKHIS